tara:strand:- start:996 stop:1370 length:375 start_codon:yes stop_codon:yes gene_type:complete
MAHPSQSFPKGFYVIDEAQTATADFFAVTCEVAGNITVKGGGRFEYVDVSALADNAAAAKYIDPLTGAAFTAKSVAEDSDHGDGFYEKIPTEATTITLAAGQTVYGNFTSVTGVGSVEVLAYYK